MQGLLAISSHLLLCMLEAAFIHRKLQKHLNQLKIYCSLGPTGPF